MLGWGYYVSMYPPEMVKAGPADWRNSTGSGPWSLAKYVRGSSVTYKRNPNYWDKATIKGKKYQLPFVDEVRWLIMPDASTQLAALRTGKVDLDGGVPWQDAKSLRKTNPKMVEVSYYYDSANVIGMRTDKPELPFKDKRVRRALSMAIDYQAVIGSQYGGEAILTGSVFSYGWPESLFTPFEKLPDTTKELFAYNPEKAKQLLAEAGYPDGFKTKLVYGQTGTVGDLLSLYVDYWDKIGVKVELKPHEWAAFMSIWYRRLHEEMIWVTPGTSSPAWLLNYHVVAENKRNPSAFNDPHAREMYDKALTTIDPVERAAIWKELEVYYMDQAPVILTPVARNYTIFWPWLKNYYGENSVGQLRYGPIYARLWIDRDLKKTMGYK